MMEGDGDSVFFILPKDVQVYIFVVVPIQMLIMCRAVCKRWRDVISNARRLWHAESYIAFCEEIRNVPLRFKHTFSPFHMKKRDLFKFLRVCHDTSIENLKRNRLINGDDTVEPHVLQCIQKGQGLLALIRRRVTFEQLGQFPQPPTNVMPAKVGMLSDAGIEFLMKMKLDVPKLIGLSARQLSAKAVRYGKTFMMPHLSEEEKNAFSSSTVRALCGSEYLHIILDEKLLTASQIKELGCRRIEALGKNKYGYYGLRDGVFTASDLRRLPGGLWVQYVCRRHMQKGLQEKLYNIEQLRITPWDSLAVFAKMAKRGNQCLREQLFRFDDIREFQVHPRHLKLLLRGEYGIKALREGLVTLENVLQHFPLGGAAIIPKEMTEEHYQNILALKKIKIDTMSFYF